MADHDGGAELRRPRQPLAVAQLAPPLARAEQPRGHRAREAQRDRDEVDDQHGGIDASGGARREERGATQRPVGVGEG
ncbi:MAG: hypothetical protein WB473_02695, partial [Pedococcus sp.]